MTKLPKCIFTIIILGIVMTLFTQRSISDTVKDSVVIDSAIVVPLETETPLFLDKSAKECLMDGLLYHGIQHPEIVYAQAVLETGNFTSKGCKYNNNLFGLMRKKRLRSFGHWNESIVFYKERIQSRYDGKSDYYAFLKRINYASDPTYVQKLKAIVKKNKGVWERKRNEMLTDSLLPG